MGCVLESFHSVSTTKGDQLQPGSHRQCYLLSAGLGRGAPMGQRISSESTARWRGSAASILSKAKGMVVTVNC